MTVGVLRGGLGLTLLVLSLLLSACGSRSLNRAPVEDRGSSAAVQPAVPSRDLSAPQAKPLPGAENAGKPGYYTVKPGDTLIRIGLDTGQNWRDLVRWNNIDKPNQIEVGQVLRVTPPPSPATAAVTRPVNNTTGVQTHPVPSPGVTSRAPSTAAVVSNGVPPVAGAAPASASSPVPAEASASEDQLAWAWPASGPVIAGFDEVKNKGVDLGGAAGDAVLAAADGRVVYADAVRGYGKLIILKHNNTYLTAYAHNQTLLVKEDQAVRRGQKIAEMGNTDADRVKLHFEVRRQGKPVDPIRYLPVR